MRTLPTCGLVLAALLCAPLASADEAPPQEMFETLDVRPLTRSTTDIYNVLEHLIQARAEYDQGFYKRSYHAFKYVALHDRNNVEAALGTANSALEIGRAIEAQAIFRNLSSAKLETDNQLAVQSGLILAKYLLDELDNPQVRLRQALDIAPNDRRLWNALGDAYQKDERWQDAVLAYERAHEAGYSRAGLHNNFGLLVMAQNRLETATRYFESASKLDPNNPTYENNFRTALLMTGQYERALDKMTDIRAAKLLTQSGQIAMENENFELAELLLLKAVEVSPVYNVYAEASLEKLNQAAE